MEAIIFIIIIIIFIYCIQVYSNKKINDEN